MCTGNLVQMDESGNDRSHLYDQTSQECVGEFAGGVGLQPLPHPLMFASALLLLAGWVLHCLGQWAAQYRQERIN